MYASGVRCCAYLPRPHCRHGMHARAAVLVPPQYWWPCAWQRICAQVKALHGTTRHYMASEGTAHVTIKSVVITSALPYSRYGIIRI